MWLGTRLGRFWASLFDGEPVGCACGDALTQIWLVSRMVPKWAAGEAKGNVILIRRDQWEHPRIVGLVEPRGGATRLIGFGGERVGRILGPDLLSSLRA